MYFTVLYCVLTSSSAPYAQTVQWSGMHAQYNSLGVRQFDFFYSPHVEAIDQYEVPGASACDIRSWYPQG